MLNNHMQSVLAYFAKPADLKSQPQSVRPQVKQPASHLQPAISYFVQDKSAERLGDEQSHAANLSRSRSGLLVGLQQLWQNLLTVNLDPQIREGVTSSGEAYWRVYDPVAQASHTFFDEEDVYRWLEQRYYE